MASSTELDAMRRAIALAHRALGTTSPNPVVGCVIVDPEGATLGEGYHSSAGGPHAEVVALRAAGPTARGGTAMVTLEPCNHTGRTGPCAQALIAAGIARVLVAVPDPHPIAAGGAETLRAAGVDVEFGVLTEEAAEGNVAWLTAVRGGRPWVVWKFAATLDGRSAAADGTSRWITSAPARRDVHRLRAEVDAILVGSGTVLADDPQLTVRGLATGERASRQPLRVVVDSTGRTPATARVRDDAAPTWIATVADVGADAGGRVDLPALLQRLYDRDVRSVLLEGGPTLAAAFLRQGLVDRVVAYLAPTLLGAGRAALGDAGIGTLAHALHLTDLRIDQLGPDLKITARPHSQED